MARAGGDESARIGSSLTYRIIGAARLSHHRQQRAAPGRPRASGPSAGGPGARDEDERTLGQTCAASVAKLALPLGG